MPATIYYLGRNDTDHTITLSINGQRWEYWLHNAQAVESAEHLAKRVSVGKALAYAKRHAKYAKTLA